MPVGVQVKISSTSIPGSGDATTAATYFLVGLAERGDTVNPILVRSLAEAQVKLGGRQTYGALYDDLACFFSENGGSGRAYVARVVGPGASVGTLSLKDTAGTPVNTIVLSATSAGAWSTNLTVEIKEGALPNTYTIVLRYQGTIVEQYNNLASPADAVGALTTSEYVRASNVGSATAAPANNPAVLAPTSLSSGSDDRAAVTSVMYTEALARFTADLGPGVVAIPGQLQTVAADIGLHVQATNRIGLVAPAQGTSVLAAAAQARALRGLANSQRLGFIYPWVTIPDGAGGLRTVSPTGYVAGVRARTIGASGTWRPPAGEKALAQYVSGTETVLTTAEINTLSEDAVSPIKAGPRGVELYGWRSLSGDEANFKFLNAADLLNQVAWSAGLALEPFVFEVIDGQGQLFSKVRNELASILAPIAAAGGLYAATNSDGSLLDPGYRIDTGPSVNTPATITAGQVRAQVSLRISPVGELILVTLTKVPLTATL